MYWDIEGGPASQDATGPRVSRVTRNYFKNDRREVSEAAVVKISPLECLKPSVRDYSNLLTLTLKSVTVTLSHAYHDA